MFGALADCVLPIKRSQHMESSADVLQAFDKEINQQFKEVSFCSQRQHKPPPPHAGIEMATQLVDSVHSVHHFKLSANHVFHL